MLERIPGKNTYLKVVTFSDVSFTKKHIYVYNLNNTLNRRTIQCMRNRKVLVLARRKLGLGAWVYHSDVKI